MQTFTLLNLTDLRLGLDDLLTVRRAPLMRTQAGKAHEEILEQHRHAINALPAPLTGGRPFAEELAARNFENDGFGTGIWHMTEAYLRAPTVDPEIAQAARRVRDAFIPDPERLRDGYPEQAAAAAIRKENLVAVIDDLTKIPVAGGGSLFDWAAAFVGAGESIGKILVQRAEINATTRKHAMTLHTETLRILNELRKAVVAEIARTMGMPRGTEDEIFGYFDILEATRVETKRQMEQNQAMAGPTSSRGLTLPPPSTQVITNSPQSSRGYTLPPPSSRMVPPPRESNSGPSSFPPGPPSSRTLPPPPASYPPPPSTRGPRGY